MTVCPFTVWRNSSAHGKISVIAFQDNRWRCKSNSITVWTNQTPQTKRKWSTQAGVSPMCWLMVKWIKLGKPETEACQGRVCCRHRCILAKVTQKDFRTTQYTPHTTMTAVQRVCGTHRWPTSALLIPNRKVFFVNWGVYFTHSRGNTKSMVLVSCILILSSKCDVIFFVE